MHNLYAVKLSKTGKRNQGRPNKWKDMPLRELEDYRVHMSILSKFDMQV